MLKRFEDVLAQCIEDIKAGRCSIEDCLAKYPSISKQLEPLLRIALEIREPPDVKPSPAFKVRARVQLMEQIHARQTVTKWPWFRYRKHVKPIAYRRRFRMVAIIVAVVLSLSALGGTAYASQDSLPGDVLYPMKLSTEQARLVLARSDTSKAELHLTFANRRVEEMTDLAEAGRPDKVNIAVNGYDSAIAMAIEKMEKASGEGVDIAEISELIALATSKHLSALDEVYDKVPDEARPVIERARMVSMNRHRNALRVLAGEKPMRALEINLAAMEGRLNRAKAKAEENNIEETEDALYQFEALHRFGEEVSEIAQGSGEGITTVEELVALATSIHLTVLDEVMDVVPEEAQEAITRAKEASINRHRNALRALAGEKPVRAIEINLAAMEGRLNRAKAKAEAGDIDAVENAIGEFEELRDFGQEVSQIAQSLGQETTVALLIARATEIHLQILAIVYENVPEQAKEAIVQAMGESIHGYERAAHALEEAGALGDIPEEPPIPEGIPHEVRERILERKSEVPAKGRP